MLDSQYQGILQKFVMSSCHAGASTSPGVSASPGVSPGAPGHCQTAYLHYSPCGHTVQFSFRRKTNYEIVMYGFDGTIFCCLSACVCILLEAFTPTADQKSLCQKM
jgi:hypothetical protein